MNRQFWPVIGLLACVSLALSACRAPATPVPPTAAPVQATVAPSATAVRAATVPPNPMPTPSITVLWTFATQGAIWGTATVADGTVYFGSDDGHLYALEARSGKQKWEFATQGIVRSRPASAGGLVYVASDDGYLYAVSAQDGKQAWRKDIGNVTPPEERAKLSSPSPTSFDIWQSSPVVANGQVYVGSMDGNVYALAADTGQISWTFRMGSKVRATPTVDNDTVYIGSWDLTFYALDARTGQKRWQTMLLGEVQSKALVAGGLVYCASRKASVVALDAQTGEKKWEYDYGTNLWVESSPWLEKGIVYVGSSGSKIVVGLDSRTGQAFTRLDANAFTWSSPCIVGNTLYIGGTTYGRDGNGGLLVIRLADGQFVRDAEYPWRWPIKETLEASGSYWGVASSPLVLDGVIYFGGLDGKMYAVERR